MLPPTNAPSLTVDEFTPTQNEFHSWVEASTNLSILSAFPILQPANTLPIQTTQWPETTEGFLRELIHTHALYTNPTSKEDYIKICSIFDEFYDKTDFQNWKPLKGDERLWQLFRVKLDQIQTEMLLRGETFKSKDGSIKRAVPLPTKTFDAVNSTSESLATPPATPNLGTDKTCDGLELWKSLDVDAQAALFRNQLRSAKNRKGLMLEWNEYCVEVRE